MTGEERVRGIGGVFFKADDPELLSAWYAEHLGVGPPPDGDDESAWLQEAGPTVIGPFGPDHWASPHLGPPGWGINFRVRDLDAMVPRSSPLESPLTWTRRNTRTAASHSSVTRRETLQLWEPSA